MADFIENSQINLNINAKQANMVLGTLKERAVQLRQELDRAASAGDAKGAKKIEKELRQVQKIITQSTKDTTTLEEVMRRLDKASPKELRKSLQVLNRQLSTLQRGSKEFDECASKIRRVREEMQRLNQAMTTQATRWERFNGWLNGCQTALMGFAAAITGAILAGKKAVQQYAGMEQEMANVRKYTGMAADEVERLNQEFLKIDTRTSREDLNKLAQEAGRLGKTSERDILGFVRAADKINVALDDLGDGATLKLSKLTGIFGDEERYGTEQSLLKVGSVINELSQNCSASAPYIAEFTERLGGVGAQAGMTIQQIMGFASVLDANAQKVEASATALSQVIVRLYQDPAKYARVAGLDIKEFSDLMRRDANSALILFLETLQKAGGMDVLSPMFKDMGENGSRAIAALSTLASNIDAVKSQQQEANKAFEEGTSIQKEFDVQNNTVQASMDKASKGLNEITVNLGKKLMPLMTHIYSSSSVMMRMLSGLVDFVSRNAVAIISLTAALGAYKLAVIAVANWTKIVTTAKAAWTAVTKAATLAVKAESAVVALLTGNLKKAREAWLVLNAAMKANPAGLAAAALTALVAVIISLTRKTREYNDEAEKIIRNSRSVSEESVREQRELEKLFGRIDAAKKGSEDYLKAKKDLIDQYGKYLSGLIDEKGEIIDLARAYDTLTEAVARSARERSLAAAKESLEDTFNEQSSKDISRLQQSLESYGASPREASELSQKVSGAVARGEKIPEDVARRVRKLSENRPSLDDEGREYSNMGQRVFAKWGFAFKVPESPEKILGRISRSVSDFERASRSIEDMQTGVNPTRMYSDDELRRTLSDLDAVIQKGEGTVDIPKVFAKEKEPAVQALKPSQYSIDLNYKAPDNLLGFIPQPKVQEETGAFRTADLDSKEAGKIREMIVHELNLRGKDLYVKESPGQELPESEPEPENTKVPKEDPFAAALKKLESERERSIDRSTVELAAGNSDWLKFLTEKHDALVKYYDDAEKLYQEWNRTEEEGYSRLLRSRAEEDMAWRQSTTANSIEETRRWQKKEEIELRLQYSEKGTLSEQEEQTLQSRLFLIRLMTMQKELSLLSEGSKEYAAKKVEIENALNENLLRIRTELAKKTAETERQYLQKSPARQLKEELEALKAITGIEGGITREQYESFAGQAVAKAKADLPGSGQKTDADLARENYGQQKKALDEWLAEGLISQEEYAERVRRIQNDLNRSLVSGISQCGSEWVQQLTSMYQAWADFSEALKSGDGDPFDLLSKGIQSTAAVMQSVMQSVTALTQAQVEIQTAAIEKRYARESAFAEGNSYLQQKLEKKKEKEIAKLRSDAAQKNFAMQVASTVAATAANAVSAYGAALQTGPAGLVLAPIAAGIALAQGALQIAVLKKQQQAASAGYAEGGFTKKGRKNEPAGIVHAGEWVASQKLVNDPRTRPVIDMLELAQRSNFTANLSMDDVSRSISAPMALAYSRPQTENKTFMAMPSQQSGEPSRLSEALDRLNERLDRPFITHNTVDGPLGIKQAQDEYARLIANKSR